MAKMPDCECGAQWHPVQRGMQINHLDGCTLWEDKFTRMWLDIKSPALEAARSLR